MPLVRDVSEAPTADEFTSHLDPPIILARPGNWRTKLRGTGDPELRPTGEFVARISLLMSLVALSMDSMLPALGDIAAELRVANPNDRQLVLTVFFLGLGIRQLCYGAG